MREFPADHEETGEPYYPIPGPESRSLAEQYRQAAESEPHTTFLGRLGRYRYYNMDQVVAQALHEFHKLAPRFAK